MPELVIDLHGFSIEKAKFCVLHSLAQAYNVDKIRIITGRGNHIGRSGERGILYKEFRSWLAESAYQSRIHKILTRDGYYEIYLRENAVEQKTPEKDMQARDLFSDTAAMQAKAEQGDPAAQFSMAMCLTFEAKDEKDFRMAFSYLLRSASNNYPEAMIAIATRYMVGRGVKQSDEEAIRWLQRALELNHLEAPVLLGDCYLGGHGVQQNLSTAVKYYIRGAELGDPIAMRKLASAYQTSHGIKRNLRLAFEWYKKAADMGEVTSQYNIATMYENGSGSGIVARDPHKAYDYYLLAANGGDPDAQSKIGFFHLVGENAVKDLSLAIEWLTLASNNGSAQASALLKWHKPSDLSVLQRSAQAGNIWDSVELKIQQRGLVATDDVLDKIFMESYVELRDLPVNNIIHLEHKSKFWLIDQLIADKSKRYQQRAVEILCVMAEGNCIFSLRRLAHIYHNGRGVRADDRQAAAYLEQARKLRDGKSTMGLAGFYKTGVIVSTSSPKQMMVYYEEAATLNYPPANYYLGLFFLDSRETQKGVAYLKKAIDLEKDAEICENFSSGFIDKYTPITSDAVFRIGTEYCQSGESKQVAKGCGYIQLAKQLGNENAEKFLADAKEAGFLDGLPREWFQPMALIEEDEVPAAAVAPAVPTTPAVPTAAVAASAVSVFSWLGLFSHRTQESTVVNERQEAVSDEKESSDSDTVKGSEEESYGLTSYCIIA